MIPYRINDQKISIPSNWGDLSFNQYMQILKNDITSQDADLNVIAICLKIDLELLKKSKLENVEQLFHTLSFVKTPAAVAQQPTSIKSYLIPQDITIEYINQFEDLRRTYDEAVKKVNGETDLFKVIPIISQYYPTWAAIYCQRIRDGEYNYDKAMAMIPEMEEASCLEILSAGTFFFYRLTNSLTGTKGNYQTLHPSQKKNRPGLGSFIKGLGSILRSDKSQKKP